MDTVCVTVFSTAVQTLSCETQKLLCILVEVLHHLNGIKSFCFKSSQLKVLILIHVVVEVLPYVHRNRRFIRDGSPGRPPRLSHISWALNMEVEERRDYIYLSLHCHHQNDSCIKMGSYESHFNVSLIMRDKVTRQCPQTTTLLKRKENRSGVEPKPFCLPA